jgi:hypothetical protein
VKIEDLLEKLWGEYVSIVPTVEKVNGILLKNNENIINDHIALRTFSHEKLGINIFEEYFKNFGYIKCNNYDFTEKKLNAIHLENTKDSSLPKIFISELRYKELSKKAVDIIDREISKITDFDVSNLFFKNNYFSISSVEYDSLYRESEYAAWLCSLGHRPNHFTISVNHLSSIDSLLELNSILKENGILLNTSGGEVKGSADVFLEQSSTMADKVDFQFNDEFRSIPSCYYEFAYRHKLPTGELYQGFVTKSADKIFESTNE